MAAQPLSICPEWLRSRDAALLRQPEMLTYLGMLRSPASWRLASPLARAFFDLTGKKKPPAKVAFESGVA